jgi:hypothetical protein
MAGKQWSIVIPAVLLLAGFGGTSMLPRGPSQPTKNPSLRSLESQVGYHLYAPTWLPAGGFAGTAMVGAHRILQDFSQPGEDRVVVIVSQEQRNPKRDKYHRRLFQRDPEAKTDINGKPGYYITGNSGERRLFWNETDSAVILSSTLLTDEQLASVARSVR